MSAKGTSNAEGKTNHDQSNHSSECHMLSSELSLANLNCLQNILFLSVNKNLHHTRVVGEQSLWIFILVNKIYWFWAYSRDWLKYILICLSSFETRTDCSLEYSHLFNLASEFQWVTNWFRYKLLVSLMSEMNREEECVRMQDTTDYIFDPKNHFIKAYIRDVFRTSMSTNEFLKAAVLFHPTWRL